MLKLFFKYLRKFLIGNYREIKLAKTFTKIFLEFNNKSNLNILDYGSGFNPTITYEMLSLNISKQFKIKIDCYDLYNEEQLKNLNKKSNISFYNISHLDENKRKYDFCLISDTLHHIGVDNNEYIKDILIKLKKKSRYIIIKDHFENGFFSRQCLRMMDFLGNFSSGVTIPKKYYTKHSFENLLYQLNFKPIKRIFDIRYHPKIFLFLSSPKFHFIYIL